MSNLFSHAEPPERQTEVPDGTAEASATRTVVVRVPVRRERAWEGFTEYIHLWWPADLTAFGEGTHVELEEGSLGEENDDGERQDWARITVAEPPARLELSWTRDRDPATPSYVVIEFAEAEAEAEAGAEAAGGTRVSVTHEGTSGGAVSAATARQEKQAPDWSTILDRYARFMGARQ